MTGRDEWVYDLNKNHLQHKIKFFTDTFNFNLSNKKVFDLTIKWSATLKGIMKQNETIHFDKELISVANFRPFHKNYFYLNDQMPHIFHLLYMLFLFL